MRGPWGNRCPHGGAPSTPAPQTRPHLGLTRGSVCSACRPFSLSDLDDYEKHFTVMNYDPEVVLKQVGGLEGPGGAWGAGSRRPRPHTRKLVFWAGSVDRQTGPWHPCYLKRHVSRDAHSSPAKVGLLSKEHRPVLQTETPRPAVNLFV